MRTKLSMLLATIVITGSVFAQHNRQHVTFGVKAGLNISDIFNDNGIDYSSRAGFNAGLLGHIHLAQHWAVQPELVYSLQGSKGSGAGSDVRNNLNYINVPVLLQYMFDNGFRLQAGPQAGFLVNANHKVPNEAPENIKDNFTGADLGLAMGISYVHPATGLGVDLRYNHGLTDINKNPAVRSTNRVVQLGVFYLFHHRR